MSADSNHRLTYKTHWFKVYHVAYMRMKENASSYVIFEK